MDRRAARATHGEPKLRRREGHRARLLRHFWSPVAKLQNTAVWFGGFLFHAVPSRDRARRHKYVQLLPN